MHGFKLRIFRVLTRRRSLVPLMTVGFCVGVASSTPAGNVINVPNFGVYAYHVSNTTIISPWSGIILTVAGSNNTIRLGGVGGHGHHRVQLIGSNNVLVLGSPGAFVDISGGSGNVVLTAVGAADTLVTSHSCGNRFVPNGTSGFYDIWDNPGQNQGITYCNHADLSQALTAFGCGFGCDPATVLSYAFPNRPEGQHMAIFKGGKDFQFYDCSGNYSTLAQFIAHSIVPGRTPESWPEPALKALAPDYGATTPNDIRIGFNAPLNYTQYGHRDLFGPWIFDAWSYQNKQNVSVTLCAVAGKVKLPTVAQGTCSGPVTGSQQKINEYLSAASYIPAAGITRDSLTMTVTNPGGGSASVTAPVAISFGKLCP